MLKIKSVHFEKGDDKILRKFAEYVLFKFVRKSVVRKANITIQVLDNDELECTENEDLKLYKAWCTYNGFDSKGRKCFSIMMNARQLRKGKTSKARLRNTLQDLAHELVHVKQYLNGELRDYVDGSYMFLGKKYEPIPEEGISEAYFDSPCEVESFGREYGLVRMFWLKVKSGEIVL